MTTHTTVIDHPVRRLVVALPRPYDAAREHYETLVPEADVGRELDALLSQLITLLGGDPPPQLSAKGS